MFFWTGRVISWSIIHNVPDSAVESLFLILQLCGLDVGSKYHSRGIVPLYATLATQLCLSMAKQEFLATPPNLPHPSCYRLMYDSVTIQNGTCVLVIIIAYTNKSGKIVSKLLGALPLGTSHSGKAVCNLVTRHLEEILGISSQTVKCFGSRFLVSCFNGEV